MLRSLYVQTLQGDNFMVGHFLRAIPINAPSLHTLEVDALGSLSRDSEAALLSAAKCVSKLSLMAITPRETFIRDLAADNKLRSLIMEFTLANTSPKMEHWKPGTFETVEEFECEALSSRRTLSLLAAVHIPLLRRLRITIGTVPSAEVIEANRQQPPSEPASVRHIMEKIPTFTQLRRLSIILPNLDDVRLTLSPDVFLPLSQCRQLESLELVDRSDLEDFDSVFVSWDDEHVTTLVKSWPGLRKLHLECSNTSAPPTQLTPTVLSILAQLCPDLRSVRLPINMSSAGSAAYTIPPVSNKVYRLTLEANTVIANDAVVADLIHALWPHVAVTAWKSAEGTPNEISQFTNFYRHRHPI
ncbi:hypothetical protein CALVIDRAFT_601121 [Calocera viscosa TUFC12733]|uniref:F-box domain-containing protein n=1 Tax=Calocera viscosa (strain TUFC12733) TaxID=1330018 RepID=A0A167IPF6_CALVF|nr:hypothetical protein CALVIDRAFT_601121 [Calocera viscosa TUFC12733]